MRDDVFVLLFQEPWPAGQGLYIYELHVSMILKKHVLKIVAKMPRVFLVRFFKIILNIKS